MNHREDRGVRSNAERKRENRSRGHGAAVQEDTNGMAKIGDHADWTLDAPRGLPPREEQ
jgi:hypothetical protein